MVFLRSLLFAIVFYIGSVPIVTGALIAVRVKADTIRWWTFCWARYHRWCCRVLLGIESRIEGKIPTGTCIVAAKHQSMYETVELVLILGYPAIVLKQELADLPLWGPAARASGAIPVDRDGNAGALRRMLKAARAAIAGNRSILIFPEGTRVVPGDQPPLRAGFAGLYKLLGLSVVPVAIDSGTLWPRGSFLKRPGVITFRFGEPIPAGLPREDAEAAVHAAINVLDQPALRRT